MKPKLFHIIIKTFLHFVLCLTGTVSFEQELQEMPVKPLIQLNGSFTHFSQWWKVKTLKKRKVEFGPFKIIDYKRVSTVKTWSENHFGLFRTAGSKKRTQINALTVLYNGTDTACVSVVMSLADAYQTPSNTVGTILYGDAWETHQAYCVGMTIRLGSDTSTWHYEPSPTFIDRVATGEYFGKIINGKDSILISCVSGLEDTGGWFEGDLTGIKFFKGDAQLAALQYRLNHYIWITTLCEERTKLLLGAFIIAHLSALKT